VSTKTHRANLLLIRTPEGVVFSQPLAGPTTRLLAYALDLAVAIVIERVAQAALVVFMVFGADLSNAFAILAFFAVQIGYGIGCEWFLRGQTIGKKLLRLRVVDAQGLRLHFSQIVLRNLLRFVDMLPGFYLVGGLACLFSRHAQRLGDLAANTVVVRVIAVHPPDLEKLTGGKYNSLRDYPHLEARLRQRVSPAEAAAALRALVRREHLEAAARVELFDEFANYFRAVVEFPPEATAGISSEQYIVNVVDILYRPRLRHRPNAALAQPAA
jgi:uncharacterized RDD family membrane protein YckC